eukprot:CAMPEP_0204135480 /NCGR_PEP_ID=MMETSP0361-20130328/16275_1 /ASSEMBLY_ACC=CAM_ASM_000343 /TAXON_ID=268821 /ORGANISM="Scrippsiella Hangoei, Strain SHTV-5" /LENGTH=218 /DNA_ID=CAMNT_0051088841 /DNA_START=248 /DNA_END=904 /DNA_ORIENTATION=+
MALTNGDSSKDLAIVAAPLADAQALEGGLQVLATESRTGGSHVPVHISSWLPGSSPSSAAKGPGARLASRAETASTMPPPKAPTRLACALQSARIAAQSSCVYAAGATGFTDQPRLRCAPGQCLATAYKKSSAGMAAGEVRKPGPGKTSAFNHTAWPLSAKRERTAAKIGKLNKTASKLLKSNFRCRVPSFMQASKNISKERSELLIGGCAMITWVQL